MKKFLIVTTLILFFCSGCAVNFKEAREFVDTYIGEFVEGNYKKMYGMLGGELKTEITYEDFEQYHRNLISSLGDIKGFEGPDVKINIFGPRPIVYTYKIQFEREWGIYFLTMSQKEGKNAITFINYLSQTMAEDMTEEILNKLPDTGVVGFIKRKTKALLENESEQKVPAPK